MTYTDPYSLFVYHIFYYEYLSLVYALKCTKAIKNLALCRTNKVGTPIHTQIT